MGRKTPKNGKNGKNGKAPDQKPAITFYPPERDGDRDRLVGALAAAVLAIARQRNAMREQHTREQESHTRPDAC